MDSTEQIDNEFLQVASLPDEQINLAHGALLIAKTAYPDLDESHYMDWERCIESFSDIESEKKIRARINHLKKQKPRIH